MIIICHSFKDPTAAGISLVSPWFKNFHSLAFARNFWDVDPTNRWAKPNNFTAHIFQPKKKRKYASDLSDCGFVFYTGCVSISVSVCICVCNSQRSFHVGVSPGHKKGTPRFHKFPYWNSIFQHPPRGGVWTLRSCLVAPLTIHLAPLGGSSFVSWVSKFQKHPYGPYDPRIGRLNIWDCTIDWTLTFLLALWPPFVYETN